MVDIKLPKQLRWPVALVLFAGCGDGNNAPAGGRVTFADGSPLTGGWVEFQSVEFDRAVTARGRIHPDGRFTLGTLSEQDGLPPGQYRALVIPPPAHEDPDVAAQMAPLVDKRFNRFETSGLSFQVAADEENDFQIVIAKPGGG